MAQEPNMSYELPGLPLTPEAKKLLMNRNKQEREGIERIGAALRANDKQIGGDHYKSMGVEPWHVIDTWPLEQRIGAYRAGALKYLMRCGGKDDRIQEIKKAGHYIDKLIEVLNEESNNTKGT